MMIAAPVVSAAGVSPPAEANAAPPPRMGWRRRHGAAALCALAVVLATLVLFAPSVGFGFLNWDDNKSVYQNPHITPRVTLSSVAQFWRGAYFELYTPITYTILAICALFARLPAPVTVLGGGQTSLNAGVFHAVGVAFHAANALLVFLLLRRLFKSPLAAGLGALAWAVHPLQAEPVAWITGHNNLFSGFFALLALLWYARDTDEAVENARNVAAPTGPLRRRTTSWYWLATFAYACALLAKPTAVAVPVLALVLAVLHYRRPWRAALVPGLLVWVALGVVVAVVTRVTSAATSDTISTAVWARPFIAGDALAFYAVKALAPVAPLALDYGRTPAYVMARPWVYVNTILVALAFAGAWTLFRRPRHSVLWPLVTLALFAGGALPVLGLVPFYFQAYSTVADRYMYLSLFGLAYAIAAVVAQNEGRERARSVPAIFLAATFAGLLALRTATHLPVFRDPVTVFTHAVTVNPQSAPGHNNLGLALAGRGQRANALRHARETARLRPDNAEAVGNLGVAYGESGDMAQAVKLFRDAVRLKPDFAEARYHLAVALLAQADAPAPPSGGARPDPLPLIREAVENLREAVRLKPTFEEAHFRLAVLLARLGPETASDAQAAMRRVVSLNPNRSEARYILGVLLANAKQYRDAEAEFRATLRLTPNYAEAHYNLGLVLLRQNRAKEAVTPLAEAVRLAPRDEKASAALARARGGAGKK